MRILRTYFTLILFIGCCLLFFASGLSAGPVYRVSDVPNVQLLDSTRFVSDPIGYLSNETSKRLDKKLMDFRQNSGVEVAVVLIPSTGEVPIEEFSLDLLRKWGLGSSECNTGILVVTAIVDRSFRIETGYGMEGVLPDAIASAIFQDYVRDNFRKEDYDSGIEGAIDAIISTIERGDFSSAERTDGARHGDFERIKRSFFLLYIILSVTLLFSSMAVLARNRSHSGPYELTRTDTLAKRWGLAMIICLPLGVFLLLWYYFYRRPRIKKRSEICPSCRHSTFAPCPLTDPAVNYLVTPAQWCEMKLGSFQYVGGKCGHCGYSSVFVRTIPISSYRQCPKCKARTLHQEKTERIHLNGITYTRTHYKCEFCHFSDYKDKREEEDVNDAGIIAGSIRGSLLGTRRGGGFGGGGFGGGSGGGGGATGRW